MQNTTIPNLIVVGAGKAGTTSLHNYLDAHPQVFGAGDKELMYFSRFMDKGVDWYKSNFKVRDGVKIYFESTPQYSFRDEFPQVPQNIYDLNPDMKIIYIVREPIKRIVSHFNHWSRTQAHTFKDIEKSLAHEKHRKFFVDRTRYYYQLQAYLALFPTRQIKVVFMEDLISKHAETMNDIFRFLGVDEIGDQIPPERHNVGAAYATDVKRWSVKDISEERIAEIQKTLSKDVQNLFYYCNKPADFWGEEYV